MDGSVERDMDRWTDCDKCRPPPLQVNALSLVRSWSGSALRAGFMRTPSGHVCKRVIYRHCQEERHYYGDLFSHFPPLPLRPLQPLAPVGKSSFIYVFYCLVQCLSSGAILRIIQEKYWPSGCTTTPICLLRNPQ